MTDVERESRLLLLAKQHLKGDHTTAAVHCIVDYLLVQHSLPTHVAPASRSRETRHPHRAAAGNGGASRRRSRLGQNRLRMVCEICRLSS